jgi:hypothetical protein
MGIKRICSLHWIAAPVLLSGPNWASIPGSSFYVQLKVGDYTYKDYFTKWSPPHQ